MPNRLGKDPDISFRPLFLLGKIEPQTVALRQRKAKQSVWWPYHHQDILFMLSLYSSVVIVSCYIECVCLINSIFNCNLNMVLYYVLFMIFYYDLVLILKWYYDM